MINTCITYSTTKSGSWLLVLASQPGLLTWARWKGLPSLLPILFLYLLTHQSVPNSLCCVHQTLALSDIKDAI